MKRLRPVHISILTIIIFVGALFIGMQSDWWILEGRKTPLDGVSNGKSESYESEISTDEEHSEDEAYMVNGNSTVADVLKLGIPRQTLESILGGPVDEEEILIKQLVDERGLKFGQVKDQLNELIE